MFFPTKKRCEWKYWITPRDYMILKQRLISTLPHDKNATNDGSYRVRSLYFDTTNKDCLHEKLGGYSHRRKYRLRSYGIEEEIFKMEIKYRLNYRISKRNVICNKTTAMAIAQGNLTLMDNTDVSREIQLTFHKKCLSPVVVTDYKREAFVYSPSNVRITFDKFLSAGVPNSFWDFSSNLNEVFPRTEIILEVKYDNYLPIKIQNLLEGIPYLRSSISKYVLCQKRLAKYKLYS